MRFIQFFSSLKLTVTLFAFSILLLFFGTLAQVENDISTVLNEYFRSFFVWIEFKSLLPRLFSFGGGFPFLGGFSLGVLLLLNLTFTIPKHFKIQAKGKKKFFGFLIFFLSILVLIFLTKVQMSNDAHMLTESSVWRVLKKLLNAGGVSLLFLWGSFILFKKRGALFLIHFSILFLIIFEFITAFFSQEATMTIVNGEKISFIDISNHYELAIVDESDKNYDLVSKIPMKILKEGEILEDEKLPFSLIVLKSYKNSQILSVGRTPQVNKGLGLNFRLGSVSDARGISLENSQNFPSFIIKFTDKKTKEDLGTYALSLWFYPNKNGRKILEKQYLTSLTGKKFRLEFRNKREYLKDSLGDPYSFTLEKFRHKNYIGTKIARDFSSLVWIESKNFKEKVNIWMNNPLRYEQKTFYQASYLPDDKGTILQVVKNPAWFIPYFSFMTILISLCTYFFMHLNKYLTKRK